MRLLEKSAGLSRAIILIVCFLILPYKTVFPIEQAVLKLILNEQDKGDFFFVLAPEGDIWMERSDFKLLGLREGLGKDIYFNGTAQVSLKSISDLEYMINEEKASLEIKATPSLFRGNDVESSYTKPYKVQLTRDSAAFLNYAVDYKYVEEESIVNISGEFGISSGDYIGTTTYTYQKTEDTDNATRLMTSIAYSDRDSLQTVTLGDFSSSSGTLGSVVLLGGVSYSKNFTLAPFFLKQPPLKLSGSLETPSDVEIYLDGNLVRKEKLSPGDFTFQNIPATTGYGTASMVIRDVYGRERIVSTPYYYSNRLLKKGIHEYSYNAGYIRQDFGVKDFSYGEPAFMSFHNFGITSNFKIGYAAEASSDLINLGPSFSFPVSHRGIVNAAFSISHSSGDSGLSGLLSYIFQSRNVKVGLFLRSDTRKYSTLTVKPSDDKVKFRFTDTLGFGGKKTGYFGVEYTHVDMHEAQSSSRIAVTYNKTLTKRASLFATASKTKDLETYNEVFFGLHVYLDRNISGSANYTKKDNIEAQRVTIQKSQPPGDGFGFRAEMVNTNDIDYVSGSAAFQNSYGLYRMNLSGNSTNMDYGLSVAGGIGFIDKSVFLSRPITDSFAKVKVDKLEDVRVYYYGNEVGRTDKNGELIVTNIRSYNDNKISIESQDIPIDYSITSLSRYISSPSRNGSVVKFAVNRIQAITGNLYLINNGLRIPAEFTRMFVQAGDDLFEGLVGRKGEFYLENVPSGRHPAKTVYKGNECKFDIIIPESTEMFLHLGDIECDEKR